jgi:putative ABC transport system permease protein
MLMLLLNGLWTGVQQRVTTYDDHLGADLVVVPAGTDSLFADPGVLPATDLAAGRSSPGSVTIGSPTCWSGPRTAWMPGPSQTGSARRCRQ